MLILIQKLFKGKKSTDLSKHLIPVFSTCTKVLNTHAADTLQLVQQHHLVLKPNPNYKRLVEKVASLVNNFDN